MPVHLDAGQQLHGISQPIRAMAVTRQSTACGVFRRDATELNANCDEHVQNLPMRACNPSCTEQEEVVECPRGPSSAPGPQQQQRSRTNETLRASHPSSTPRCTSQPSTRSHCFDQALESTRRSALAANITSTPTVATPSVVVPPQATVIPRLGKENVPPPAEPVSRLTRASSSRTRSTAAALADTHAERSTPVSSVNARGLDLQPVSPMFLNVEVFSYAVKPTVNFHKGHVRYW